MFFKTAKAADDILLEEFFRFPWTIKIADKCKHSQQFKQWNLLINYIDSYFEYKNKVNANRRVDFKLEHSKYSLDILDEINKYLEKNSNISNFGIGIKSSWRNFIKSISIDGKTPQTREDFLAIESELKLYNAKTTIVKLWNQLLVNIGFAKLNKDTHVFEKKISSYYQPIKNSVYWFHYIWRPFYETLISSGFYWQRFLTEYMNYYVEYGLIKMLLNGGMRELSKLINFKIESIKNKSYLDSTTEETFNVDLLSFNTYIDSIKKIKSENNDILFNLIKQKRNNINVLNLEEIYTEIITNNVSYDLIIIDDAELLSMQEMLLLAYCEKSIIIGDNNFGYSSVLEKFKDYDKIFKALLPDLNPDYFTGSFSLMNIISSFMSSENKFFFLNDLNPIINSLRNDYGEGNLLGFSTLTLPLYACFYDLRSIKVASLYKIIRDSFKDVDTEESTLNIYLNATNKKLISKLKSFLVNDSSNINFSNIIVTSSLLEAKSYSCDYLIILNINVLISLIYII